MRGRLGVVALAGVLGGCSLLGLTDVPPQGECDRCEELNLIDLPPDCMSWQCGPDNLCVVDLVDQDGDGAPFPRCALDERPADCDDEDGQNRPGNAEVCDARTNDCDEQIDEGIELRLETVFPSAIESVAWARQPGEPSDTLFASARLAQGRLLLVQPDAPFEHPLQPVPAASSGTALAVFGEERAVVYTDFECGQLRVLRWAETVSAASMPLPRALGCDPAQPAQGPSLELDSERRGLTVAQVGARATCEASGGGALSAALIVRPAVDWESASEALSIGMHEGLGPAALLASEPFGFVVAHVEAEVLRLTAVEVNASDLSLSARELHSEACGAACGRVALASTVVDEVTQVAVAFQAGGCAEPQVRLRRFAVSGDALAALADTEVVADAATRRIALAGRPEAPSWAVAWADEEAVRVARPSESPIAELVVPTPGRVEQAMDLAYGDRVSLALFEPNTRELARTDLACPARVEPAED